MLEKAITSDDYAIFILMMDISRAFDTADRKLLMNTLESILQEDVLHMIKILLENVSLVVVRCGDTLVFLMFHLNNDLKTMTPEV